MVSGNRFRMRTHALDALETFPYRFDNFYFPSKNHDFRKFQKILENPLILAQVTYPGWLAADRSRGAREEAGSVRGGAAGVPEARNMSGMSSVMSVPILMAIRGLKPKFS